MSDDLHKRYAVVVDTAGAFQKGKVVLVRATKAYEAVAVQLHAFLA